MKINLSWDPSVSVAPTGFQAEVQQAATMLDNAILNPITVTIQVGWNEIGGTPMPPNSGGRGGPSSTTDVNYFAGIAGNNQQAMALLTTQANLNNTPAIAASLPNSDPFNGTGYVVLSPAQAKVFGVTNPYATAFDGQIGLAMPSWASSSDMINAALHELAHALGRLNGWVVSGQSWYTSMDAYTYSAPGQIWDPASSTPGYFSLDGGKTNLGNFSTLDAGDFVATIPGPFSAITNENDTLTPLDNQVLQSLGFAVAANNVTLALDTTTHVAASTAYAGSGSDTVTFSGSESQYHIDTLTTPGIIVVQDTLALRDGASSLSNVARLQFADTNIAFDLSPTQSTGQSAELLGAAFGTSALSDKTMLGDWINFFDHGGSMTVAAQDMVASGALPGSNSAFVSAVWQNVVGTPIDSTNLTLFTTDLANGTLTLASLLTIAAETATNQATQGLTTLNQSGVSFTPVTITGSVNSVTYTNPSNDYSVTGNAVNNTVTVTGAGVTDPMVNVQRVHFSDETIAFDLGANQSAGEAVLLLSTAQGNTGISNKTNLGAVIATLDGGGTLTQAAQNLLTSGAIAYSGNTDMVTKVWQNVVGTPIDSVDLSLFTMDLSNGTFSQASLLALAAETTTNLQHVSLLGIAAHGVAFT